MFLYYVMKLNTQTSGIILACAHTFRWCRDANPMLCRALEQPLLPKSHWLRSAAKGFTEGRSRLKRLGVSGLQCAAMKTLVTFLFPSWVVRSNGQSVVKCMGLVLQTPLGFGFDLDLLSQKTNVCPLLSIHRQSLYSLVIVNKW